MMLDTAIIDIHGRPFNGVLLTGKLLADMDLAPVKKTEVNGREILLSPIFTTPHKRSGCIAYVNDGERFVARTFFLSRSQGVWRLLRRYRFVVSDDGIEKPNWHDKGFSEDSLLVPLAIQKTMADLEHLSGEHQDLELAFYGTVYAADQTDEYQQLIQPQPLEIEENYPTIRGVKSPPELLTFIIPDKAPDLTKPILEWQQSTGMYGDVIYRVFPSFDGLLSYLFIKASDGRAWIGGVETVGEVSSLGIRDSWVRARDLATPPYEYQSNWDEDTGIFKIDQTGGYGNPDNRHGHYVDMFKNYLSKVPVLIEFVSRY